MRALLDELKAAVSGLARTPAFTALAAGVLGLGLGAVIFMYGVADTLMLKPPPYPNADRLYMIATIDGQTAGDYDDSMLPQDYLKVREAATQFEALGSIYVGTTYLTGDGQAERYDGGFADGHVFDVTGIAPELGRTIEPRDARENAAPVVVLSHELWTERFDADPKVIGRTVRVNGKSSEVIGVMPKGFSFPSTVQLWIANQQDATRVSRHDAVDVQVFGRLREAASLDVAQQELAPAAAAIKAEVGKQAFNGYFEILPMAAGFIGSEGTTLVWTLLVAVGFVLLIACANVSNLLLARSAYRVRETTVRSALGASRGRLVLHMIAEGFVISAIATAIGLLLASIALDGMQLAVTRLLEDSPNWWRFEIDYRVAIVAVGAALLSTLFAGLPAAIRASRPSLDSLLRDGGRMGTGGRARLPAARRGRADDEERAQRYLGRGRRGDRRHHDRARWPHERHLPGARGAGTVLGHAPRARAVAAGYPIGRRDGRAARARDRGRSGIGRGPRLRRSLDQAVRQPTDREPDVLRNIPHRPHAGPTVRRTRHPGQPLRCRDRRVHGAVDVSGRVAARQAHPLRPR
jgi:predicted permease